MNDNVEIVRRLHTQVYQKGEMDVINELLSEDYVEHDPVGIDDVEGREGYKQVVQLFRTAFPDLSIHIEETVAEGQFVVIRYTMKGTHEGPLLGINPTGNEIEITGMDIGRVDDGCLQEAWVQLNTFDLLQQIDVLPDDSELF
jgi:steroid delta-isomerase-like uncharacterized protein